MRQPFRKASVYIALLLILQALTGLVIIIVTAVYQSILSSYLDEIESRLLFTYLFSVYVFGAQLIVTFLCSISLWNRLWNRRCTPNVRLMISIWLFYSCVIVASGFACVGNLYYNMDVFENMAESSLYRGIDEYYSCPEWKLLWDGLQLRKQCCGVNSYKDWMNADWMPIKGKNRSSRKLILAPIACSKRSVDNNLPNYMFGSEDYAHVNSPRRQPFPTLTIDSINIGGCMPVFSASIWRYFYILIFLTLMALKFLICLCCLSKFILQRQNLGDGTDNGGLTDEDGHPLVMVKYPRNVRCITIGEDDLASDMAPEAIYCNCEDAGDGCNYCEG